MRRSATELTVSRVCRVGRRQHMIASALVVALLGKILALLVFGPIVLVALLVYFVAKRV